MKYFHYLSKSYKCGLPQILFRSFLRPFLRIFNLGVLIVKEFAQFSQALNVDCFPFDLCNIFCIEKTMLLLPCLSSYDLSTCFFPDGVKVNPKQVYFLAVSISLSLQQNLNFFMFVRFLLNIWSFLYLVPHPNGNSVPLKY